MAYTAILTRFPDPLLDAIAQQLEYLRTKNVKLTRSELLRRGVMYAMDNLEDFIQSPAMTRDEREPMTEKKNDVDGLWQEVERYTANVLNDHTAPLSEKRMVFLINKLGAMIHRLNDFG